MLGFRCAMLTSNMWLAMETAPKTGEKIMVKKRDDVYLVCWPDSSRHGAAWYIDYSDITLDAPEGWLRITDDSSTGPR